MNVGNFWGAILGVELINGKLKPKFGMRAVPGIAFCLLFCLASIIGFVYCLFNFNLELCFATIVGIVCSVYLLCVSPYTQNSNNYYIEYQNENSLDGFRLYYKKRLINISYIVMKDGKIAFANNNNKLSCVSYSDGSKMSNFTKYKILNYFGKWLHDNQLLSDTVTTTFEKL